MKKTSRPISRWFSRTRTLHETIERQSREIADASNALAGVRSDYERAARRVCSAVPIPYNVTLTPGENINVAIMCFRPHLKMPDRGGTLVYPNSENLRNRARERMRGSGL